MRVNQLAKSLSVTPDTVRFYTRIKVLQPVKNKTNGYHEYSEKDVSRLRFVLSARQLGFSVDDIQEILGQADMKKSPCPTVRRLIDQRLHETEQRYLNMVQLRERMVLAVKDWSDKPDKAPTGDVICHLIEEFRPTVFEVNMMVEQTNEIGEKEKSGGCCCSDKVKHQTEKTDRTTQISDLPLHTLVVKGATCGSCVAKIERALQSVAGVEEARMNLSTETAIVSGDVATKSLISALANVGFSVVKAK